MEPITARFTVRKQGDSGIVRVLDWRDGIPSGIKVAPSDQTRQLWICDLVTGIYRISDGRGSGYIQVRKSGRRCSIREITPQTAYDAVMRYSLED